MELPHETRSLNVVAVKSSEERYERLKRILSYHCSLGRSTLLLSSNLGSKEVQKATHNVIRAAQHLYTIQNPKDLYAAVTAYRSVDGPEHQIHIVIEKPVVYEPHASMVSFGGLTIPFVVDEWTAKALKAANSLTVFVEGE